MPEAVETAAAVQSELAVGQCEEPAAIALRRQPERSIELGRELHIELAHEARCPFSSSGPCAAPEQDQVGKLLVEQRGDGGDFFLRAVAAQVIGESET